MGLYGAFRRRWQRLATASVVFCLISFSIVSSRRGKYSGHHHASEVQQTSQLRMNHPLLWEHIHTNNVTGGGMFTFRALPRFNSN